MPYRLPPLNSLRAFEAAARHLSFKHAADELHVTPGAVSQQIKGLEAYLGFALFRRLPRRLTLTLEGEAMLPKLREGFDCLATAVARSRPQRAEGVLVVATPPAFAQRWLMPRLPRFAAAHPEVELRLSTSLGTIDSHEGLGPDRKAVDPRAAAQVEIRFGNGRYPGLRADRVFAVTYVPVCAPGQVEGLQPLRQPADLKHRVLIHDDTIPDAALRPTWAQWLGLAGVQNIDPAPGPHFSNSGLAMEAAIDGLGVALVPKPLAEAEIAAGRLCLPFDLALDSGQAYWLVYHEALAERPVVEAFRAWLLTEARAGGHPLTSRRPTQGFAAQGGLPENPVP